MSVTVGGGLALALALLVALAVTATSLGGVGLGREQVIAAVRAIVQLAAVSLVITAAVASLWGALAFAVVMFVVAVWTTTGRVGVRAQWPWAAVALLAGALPVLAIVFGTGASPLSPIAVVALAGIVTGNMMSAHTLVGRRLFAELRDNIPSYEAALALGFVRRDAIGLVVQRVLGEALLPNLDQTRTVGLVTLPGAFIGVLLGGGDPVQAGAAQVLVLIGIMAGQAITVVTVGLLARAGRLLPEDLAGRLRA